MNGDKQCKECNGIIPKGIHESRIKYSRRKFCNNACSRMFAKKNGVGWHSYNTLYYIHPKTL